jgi:3-oxoacyl-[acyl-carrier protein] reductase
VSLNEQVAIVTGAAKGIGAAIAERLTREGATVAIADIDEVGTQREAEKIGTDGGQAFALHVDVSDPASARAMVEAVVERTGRLDILVNNAGINGPTVPVVEVSVEEWRRVLAIDLDGVFYCCRAAVPHLVRRGYGRIVNIASIAGKEGNPNHSPYSTAKAGVIGFTKSLGKELATTGVLVNCVAPALIDTDLTRGVSEEMVRYLVGRVPMGRMGQASEVAALVAWLCSPECSFSTGAVFDLSGGRATY